jgi:hypothetical protein
LQIFVWNKKYGSLTRHYQQSYCIKCGQTFAYKTARHELQEVQERENGLHVLTFLPSFFAFPLSSSAHEASSAAFARASASAWALFAAFSFAPSFFGIFEV